MPAPSYRVPAGLLAEAEELLLQTAAASNRLREASDVLMRIAMLRARADWNFAVGRPAGVEEDAQ